MIALLRRALREAFLRRSRTGHGDHAAKFPSFASVVAALALLPIQAHGQEAATPAPPSSSEAVEPVPEGDGPRPKLVIAPIPQSDPTLGTGVTVVAMSLYRVGGSQQAWTTGGGAMYTDSRSWGALLLQRAYFRHDTIRVTAIAGYGDFNIDFYGVGADAAARGQSVGLNQKGYGAIVQGLVEVQPNLFVGPRLQYVDLTSRLTTPPIPGLGIDPADLTLNAVSVSLGLGSEYDTRDSEYGPRTGTLASGQWLVASPDLGSDFSYSKFQASINGYHPAGDKGVLAGRVFVCGASDDAPFFDLCLFGSHNDLRGYASGQYRDSAMVAAQMEFRRRLFWRIGYVAFAGVGSVAPGFSDLGDARLLPAAGVGLRFEASAEYRLNFSIDAAVGDHSAGVYVYLGEAF